MKYWRDICQLTYTFQTSTAEIFCSFVHKTCFCSCLCGTSGSYDYDIVCDQFLHHSICAVSGRTFGLLHPTIATAPRITPDVTHSRSGLVVPVTSTWLFVTPSSTLRLLLQSNQQLLSVSYPGYVPAPVFGS